MDAFEQLQSGQAAAGERSRHAGSCPRSIATTAALGGDCRHRHREGFLQAAGVRHPRRDQLGRQGRDQTPAVQGALVLTLQRPVGQGQTRRSATTACSAAICFPARNSAATTNCPAGSSSASSGSSGCSSGSGSSFACASYVCACCQRCSSACSSASATACSSANASACSSANASACSSANAHACHTPEHPRRNPTRQEVGTQRQAHRRQLLGH